MEVSDQQERFQEFFELGYKKQIHEILTSGEKSFIVDFFDLASFDNNLSELLLDDPSDVIRTAEYSILDVFSNIGEPIKDIRVRFKNLPTTQNVQIKDIRAVHLGKLISVKGIIRQSSDVRPRVVSATFECPACGSNIKIAQLDQKFREPSRCTCGRMGKFKLIDKDLVDAQRIVVEEMPESLKGGEQPKRLSVFLNEDLVEPKKDRATTPGTKVECVGRIVEIPIIDKSGGKLTRFDIAMDVNYIEPMDEDFSEINIDDAEIEEIKKLSEEKDIFLKLRNSIATSIFGHDKIKEAIVLQLMGGRRKVRKDGTTSRGDIHILLVGDPGSGKSAILQFVTNAAPKSRFVSGKSSTSAGLTASVVKDEFMKGWALEAGAMVLANKGICLIDELDKMSPEDTSALHEALEQQQVSIAKANIQATLKTETTVLAAANPEMGRFDPYNPIASQIKMPPTLINRFDLIFLIRDIPNESSDKKIASHIMKIHQSDKNSIEPEIRLDLVRKYIAYAKQKIVPELTDEAVKEIISFYVDLRNKNKNQEGEGKVRSISITARQLEALVRMAEASAKVRLSEKVTKEDAIKAIELLKYSLSEVGIDKETGQFDIDMIHTGISASSRNRISIIKKLIDDLGADKRSVAIEEIISEAAIKGIEKGKTEEILEKLKSSGDIFSPKYGYIKKM